jgi:signal transduction histidine kinase
MTASPTNPSQLLDLLDTIGMSALHCHRNGQIESVNDSLASLLMGDRDHLHEMRLHELTAFADIVELVEAGQPILKAEAREVGELHCLVRMQAFGDDDLVLTFEDVSDYHERETQLHDSIRMVVHDLKTPISAIKSYADLIQQLAPLPEQSAQFLSRIPIAADTLNTLLSDLRDLTWIDTNRSLDVQTVQLAYLLHNTLESVQAIAEHDKVIITIDVPADVPPLQGDSVRLQRVFANLLTNAIKFSPPGGEVSVHVSVEDEFITTTIQDQGPGIEAQYLPYIFERFYRVPVSDGQAANSAVQGSGLGLAIVHEIVRRHDGDVSVSSTVGKGTSFTVRLPLQRPA